MGVGTAVADAAVRVVVVIVVGEVGLFVGTACGGGWLVVVVAAPFPRGKTEPLVLACVLLRLRFKSIVLAIENVEGEMGDPG